MRTCITQLDEDRLLFLPQTQRPATVFLANEFFLELFESALDGFKDAATGNVLIFVNGGSKTVLYVVQREMYVLYK